MVVNYKSYDMYSFEVSEEKDILEAIESKFYGGVKVPVYKFITETSDTRSGFTAFYLSIQVNLWSILILMKLFIRK